MIPHPMNSMFDSVFAHILTDAASHQLAAELAIFLARGRKHPVFKGEVCVRTPIREQWRNRY